MAATCDTSGWAAMTASTSARDGVIAPNADGDCRLDVKITSACAAMGDR